MTATPYHNSPRSQVDNEVPPPPPDERIDHIYELIGENTILLVCPPGQKGPRDTGWADTTLAESKSSAYRERLENSNIAVLLGQPSGDICAIDIDTDDGVEKFLESNPRLKGTLRSRGARGCQVWTRMKGEYPGSVLKFTDAEGEGIGEWRGGGGCSMIDGRHPDGMEYTFLVDAPVISIAFSDIVWPAEWRCPWRKSEYQKLVDAAGEPFRDTKGGVSLNQHFLCQKYALDHEILFEPESRRFYEYNPETGAYQAGTEAALKTALFHDIGVHAGQQDEEARKRIMHAANNRFLTEVVQLLKGHVEKREGFLGIPELIHARNCMVFVCFDEVFEQGFSPDHYSRNQSPIAYIRDAKCPRFLKLLEDVLDADDIDLMQRMFGYVLKPGNRCHKIFLLTGQSATSKSTIVSLLEALIGGANVGQLRAQHLGSRFELGGLLGKTLLTGKDVPADFLKAKDAEALKSMVGGDRLEAELKGCNERIPVTGSFHMVVASNHRLTIRPSGDADAWRRRLIAFDFVRPFSGKCIRNLCGDLIRSEGSGILNWAIKGLIKVNQEIDDEGGFVLNEAQRQRVDEMLAASDSLRRFLEGRVSIGEGNLSTEELTAAYFPFCAERNWPVESQESVAKRLPELMSNLFQSEKSHSVQRGRGMVRGFRGVTWRN